MRPATQPYRTERPSVAELAAGAVLTLDPTGEILLLHHASEDRWCLPKGHVEAGESIPSAALREVIEETGIRSLTLEAEIAQVSYRFYDPRKDCNVFKTTVYWRARTSDRGARPEALFDEFRWVARSEAVALLPFPEERKVVTGMTTGAPSQGRSEVPRPPSRRSGPRGRAGRAR